MNKRTLLTIIAIIGLMLILFSCAEVAHCTPQYIDEPYGFFAGLWHGWIAAFAFVGSLISDDIAIYAVNNNGGWYNFGFLLGVGSMFGGGIRISFGK